MLEKNKPKLPLQLQQSGDKQSKINKAKVKKGTKGGHARPKKSTQKEFLPENEPQVATALIQQFSKSRSNAYVKEQEQNRQDSRERTEPLTKSKHALVFLSSTKS